MTQEVKIPNDRIGAIIGKGGETRKHLEKVLKVTLDVDSQTGIVEITNENDALAEIRSMEVAGKVSPIATVAEVRDFVDRKLRGHVWKSFSLQCITLRE